MARAMRASGEVKPKGMRVMRRILVFMVIWRRAFRGVCLRAVLVGDVSLTGSSGSSRGVAFFAEDGREACSLGVVGVAEGLDFGAQGGEEFVAGGWRHVLCRGLARPAGSGVIAESVDVFA
jgi:hypothetical protein